MKLQELTEQEIDMVSGGDIVGDLGTALDKSILAISDEFGRIENALTGIAQTLTGLPR